MKRSTRLFLFISLVALVGLFSLPATTLAYDKLDRESGVTTNHMFLAANTAYTLPFATESQGLQYFPAEAVTWKKYKKFKRRRQCETCPPGEQGPPGPEGPPGPKGDPGEGSGPYAGKVVAYGSISVNGSPSYLGSGNWQSEEVNTGVFRVTLEDDIDCTFPGSGNFGINWQGIRKLMVLTTLNQLAAFFSNQIVHGGRDIPFGTGIPDSEPKPSCDSFPSSVQIVVQDFITGERVNPDSEIQFTIVGDPFIP